MMRKIKLKVLGFEGTIEWLYKEEGSWEDHDHAASHVHSILRREMDNMYMTLTYSELQTLAKSISYHAGAGWDGGDSKLQLKRWHTTWKAYEKRINELLIKHKEIE